MHDPAETRPGAGDAKEVIVLNRVIRWTSDGLEYEADPRQAEKFVEECGLQGANPVATPGVRQSIDEVAKDQLLEKSSHTAYRGAAARVNYLAADRPDIQFAAKEVCRFMSAPTQSSWNALRRLARYLSGLPRMVFQYKWQEANTIDVYTDTDWAGCPRTRKSTTGGVMMMGSHVIKAWSSTQASIALSSGEAEFNGVVKGSGVGLGFQALLKDLGEKAKLRIWTDSSASIGICTRQGLGKLRHLDTHTLWIQQAVRSQRIDLRKVDGAKNPADLLTKHSLTREKMAQLVALYDCKFKSGRAEAAPQTRKGAKGKLSIADLEGKELQSVMEDGIPIMPHRMYDQEALDYAHPSMSVPDELVLDDNVPDDCGIEERGRRIIEQIIEQARLGGRKRRAAAGGST